MSQFNYISQNSDIKDEKWKNKSCTIASLAMAISFLKKEDIDVNSLLEEGLKIKAYDFERGGFWVHSKISVLAHNHGLASYNEEYKSLPFGEPTIFHKDFLEYGFNKIFNFLKNKEGVIIASLLKNFSETDKPHSVFFYDIFLEKNEKGEEIKYFVVADSDKDNAENGKKIILSENDFKKCFRRLAIFINKI